MKLGAFAILRPNLFTWLLAVVTGLIGFYVTVVVEELRSGHTATYSFRPDRKTGTVEFHLTNLSRTHQISKANFLIRCEGQKLKCFAPFENKNSNIETFSKLLFIPPNFGRPTTGNYSNETEISVCLGAIANSSTAIKISPEQGSSANLMAFYNPWSKTCSPNNDSERNLLLLKPWDLHAVFAKYYFSFISFTLIIAVVLLLLTAISIFAHLQDQTEGTSE